MNEKESILDEFTQVTGFHRKHAIRVLNGEACKVAAGGNRGTRSRIYDEAVREALIVVCEAADRICGKRLKQIIAVLVAAMQRHGHLKLDVEIQQRLLAMSAATMDRMLRAVREVSQGDRRRWGAIPSCGTASRCGPLPTGMIHSQASSRWILWRTAASPWRVDTSTVWF